MFVFGKAESYILYFNREVNFTLKKWNDKCILLHNMLKF